MKIRLFATLLIALISIAGIAQQFKLEYQPLFPMSKEWKHQNWVIVSADNDEIVAYNFVAGTDFTKPKLNFVRFTKDFQVKSKNTVKLEGLVRNLHVSNDKIHIIETTYERTIHTALDVNTLQVLKSELLYQKQFYDKICVRWSPNSKYMALLAIFETENQPSDKYQAYRRNKIILYDSNLQEINNASVDAFDNTGLKSSIRWDKLEHYNPDMIVTDNGEIIYASMCYARFPQNNPEFGSGTKLVVNILNKEGLQTYDFGKVDSERRIDLPSILSYDGKEILISGIGMTLLSCNLLTKTVTIKSDNKNWGLGGSGSTLNSYSKVITSLSKVTNAGDNGFIVWGDKALNISRDPNSPAFHAIRKMRDFYWINRDGSNFMEGSIKNHEKDAEKNIFKLDITGTENYTSFYKDGNLYWISRDYSQKGMKKSGYSEKYLLRSINRQGEVHEKEISDLDMENSTVYQMDDTHFLIWQQNIKNGKEYMQRLGVFTIY